MAALKDCNVEYPNEYPDALTIGELAVVWGCVRSTAETRIQLLLQKGKARTVRVRRRARPDSKYYPQAAYILVDQPQPKGSK
jgi:hypothetical protein